jgi:hypothetical protein
VWLIAHDGVDFRDGMTSTSTIFPARVQSDTAMMCRSCFDAMWDELLPWFRALVAGSRPLGGMP